MWKLISVAAYGRHYKTPEEMSSIESEISATSPHITQFPTQDLTIKLSSLNSSINLFTMFF